MRLRCYACGEPLKEEFYLVSYQDDSDRVFVFDSKCVDRADPEALTQKVKR